MRTPARNKPKNNPDIVCPLFADFEPTIYAKNVGAIRLRRFEKTTQFGRGDKIPLTRADYYINGDEDDIFEISPFTHTEEDLQEQFGAGEYWIDPLDKNGKPIMDGRRLVLGGVFKRGGMEVVEPEEESESTRTNQTQPPVQVIGAPAVAPEFFQLFQSIMTDRERRSREDIERERSHAGAETKMQNEFAHTMLQMAAAKDRNSGNVDETIAAIRYQLDAEIKKSIANEDALRRDHREQLARRDRDIEDERKLHREELNEERRRSREDLARRDREIEDLRRNMSREELEIRGRWQKDNDEVRSRFERDLTQTRSDMLELRLKLTKENDEIRSKSERRISELEAEIRTLMKKNLELEKDLIKAKVNDSSDDEDSGPGFFQQMAPIAQKIITDVASNTIKQQQAQAQVYAQPQVQEQARIAYEQQQAQEQARIAYEQQRARAAYEQAQQHSAAEHEPIIEEMFQPEQSDELEASEA